MPRLPRVPVNLCHCICLAYLLFFSLWLHLPCLLSVSCSLWWHTPHVPGVPVNLCHCTCFTYLVWLSAFDCICLAYLLSFSLWLHLPVLSSVSFSLWLHVPRSPSVSFGWWLHFPVLLGVFPDCDCICHTHLLCHSAFDYTCLTYLVYLSPCDCMCLMSISACQRTTAQDAYQSC